MSSTHASFPPVPFPSATSLQILNPAFVSCTTLPLPRCHPPQSFPTSRPAAASLARPSGRVPPKP
jgi:hypothetical protein